MTPTELLVRQLTEARRDPNAAEFIRQLTTPDSSPRVAFYPIAGGDWYVDGVVRRPPRPLLGLMVAWAVLETRSAGRGAMLIVDLGIAPNSLRNQLTRARKWLRAYSPRLATMMSEFVVTETFIV